MSIAASVLVVVRRPASQAARARPAPGAASARAGAVPDSAMFSNRVTELLGVDIPIVQAPMGWIARAQLASAVSEAGAMGIIETSSGELDAIRDEIRKMRDLTDKPFGVNIAQAFVRDAEHRRLRGGPGHPLRHHVGGQPHAVHGGR